MVKNQFVNAKGGTELHCIVTVISWFSHSFSICWDYAAFKSCEFVSPNYVRSSDFGYIEPFHNYYHMYNKM